MEANPSEALKLTELLECDLQATNDLVTRTINGYDYLDILETIKQALINYKNITKQIEEADYKSAIVLLVKVKDNLDSYTYNTILDALLKAQETKQYLKWEDLDFKEETSRIEVKLNETLYTLSYVKRQYLDFVYLINNDSQIRLNSANDIQFFNDLHLERMEE